MKFTKGSQWPFPIFLLKRIVLKCLYKFGSSLFVTIHAPTIPYVRSMVSIKACMWIFLTSFLLGGCQQALHRNCKKANWYKEAYLLALKGQGRDIYKKKASECLKFNVKINKSIFFKGYEKGALLFCQPDWAYKFGLDNQTYKDTCPKKMEKKFFKNYFKGQLHYYKKKLQLKSKELAESDSRLWRKRNEYELEANTHPETASEAFDKLESSKAENTRIRSKLNDLKLRIEALKKNLQSK